MTDEHTTQRIEPGALVKKKECALAHGLDLKLSWQWDKKYSLKITLCNIKIEEIV